MLRFQSLVSCVFLTLFASWVPSLVPSEALAGISDREDPLGAWMDFTLPMVVNMIGGDFDGRSFLVSRNEVFLVPRVDSGVGFGGQVMLRMALNNFGLGCGLGYYRSGHEVTFGRAHERAHLVEWTFPVEARFLTTSPVQILASAELLVSDFTVENGSSNGSNSGDARFATFADVIIRGGPCVSLLPHAPLSFSIEAGYRFVEYGVVYGVNGKKTEMESPLAGNGWVFTFGVTYSVKVGDPP